MSGVPPAGATDAETGPERRGTVAGRLLTPKTISGAVILALAVWFMLANNAPTRIHLWVVWVTARLWIVLAVDFVAGVLLGLLLRRRSRNKRSRQ